MIRLIYFSLFLFLFLSVKSSDRQILFSHQLINAEGRSVKQFFDGSFYFVGYADDSIGNTNSVLTKLDPDGNVLWWKSFGDSTINLSLHISFRDSGNLVVIGERINSGNTDFEIFLVDSAGGIIWHHVYATSKNESLQFIMQTADNGFLACGYITQANLVANDFLVVKFDSSGAVIWQREYGTPRNDYAKMLRITAEGKIVISGDTHNGRDVDNLLVLIDSAGNEIWQRIAGDANDNGNQSVIINHAGDFVMCGESTTPGNFLFDVFLASFDPSGNFLWSTYMGGDGSEAGFSITENDKHEYFVTGYSTSMYTGAPYTGYLLKLDSSFHPVGLKYFPEPDLSICYEAILLTDSTVALAGTSGNSFFLVLAEDSGYTANFIEHDFVSYIKELQSQDFEANVFLTEEGILKVRVEKHNSLGEYELFIWDVTGRLISGSKFINSTSVDLSAQPSGLLVWQIQNRTGGYLRGKVYRP